MKVSVLIYPTCMYPTVFLIALLVLESLALKKEKPWPMELKQLDILDLQAFYSIQKLNPITDSHSAENFYNNKLILNL